MNQDLVLGLQDAGWPVLLIDSAGSIAWSNAAAAKFFGPALQGPGVKLAAIWSPENAGSAQDFVSGQQRASSAAVPVSFRLHDSSVARFLVSACACASGGPNGLLIQLLPDPSAAPGSRTGNSEGQVLKQKLDCALQLARTVALDFNNALTSILGHTSLILSKMEPSHPWRQSLLEVEKSSAKAAEIANDLGTFSRQEKEPRAQSAGNLNELLQRSVEFFQQNAGTTPVAWKLQLERKLFTSKFDEAKMQQAFIKIFENAVQAIEIDGRIIVQSRNIELAEPTQDRTAKLSAGAWVCAEISDNGSGIPEDVLPRIFDPFFTTKQGPQHRGLGLAWVYGIVTNHGGGVAVSSQVGRGTSVRVYLPAEKQIARSASLEGQDLSGTQTILIVDDEDLLLTMGQTILSAYGYRVLTANSGQKALDTLSKPDCSVDLMITDLVMPSMSGRELIEHVQVLCPSVRIICTSGYIWPASQQSQGTYLQKPFTSQELLLKVKEVLAPKERGA